MDYQRYRTIGAERKGRILTLTLNRPEAYNAVDHRGCYEVYACTARLMVNTGRGARTVLTISRAVQA